MQRRLVGLEARSGDLGDLIINDLHHKCRVLKRDNHQRVCLVLE